MMFVFVLFSLIFGNAFSSDEKKIGKLIEISVENERFTIHAVEGKFRIERKDDPNLVVIICLDVDNKDDRSIYLLNNKDKYYVSLCCKEINQMTKFKRMFFPEVASDSEIEIISMNDMGNRAGYSTKRYRAEFQNSEAVAEFSREAQDELTGSIKYLDLLEFFEGIDFDILGIPDISFEAIKSFVKKSRELGMLAYLEVWENEVYSLTSIEDKEIEDTIFEVDKSLDKKGWDAFIGELF